MESKNESEVYYRFIKMDAYDSDDISASPTSSVTSSWIYDQQDPYSIIVRFYTSPQVTWRIARELLEEVVEAEPFETVGEGDIKLTRIATSEEDELQLVLSSDSGQIALYGLMRTFEDFTSSVKARSRGVNIESIVEAATTKALTGILGTQLEQ